LEERKGRWGKRVGKEREDGGRRRDGEGRGARKRKLMEDRGGKEGREERKEGREGRKEGRDRKKKEGEREFIKMSVFL